ncbi:MAG: DUF5711 family protein [Clostridia bacterium]|nr:DUF5711 family protein [Clostridia bacterium]
MQAGRSAKKKKLSISHRTRNIILISIAAALLIGSVLAVMLAIYYAPIKLTELPFSSQAQYDYTGSGFYALSGTSIYYYDDRRVELNTVRNVNNPDVKLVVSANIALIYTNTAVYVMGSDSPVEIGGSILDVKCGKDYIAVYREDAAGAQTITLYTSSMEEYETLSFDGVYALDFGFDLSRSETLWTLDVDTQSSAPVSTIRTYDLGRRAASGIVTVQNQLVEDVFFTDDCMFVVGTSTIRCVDRTRNSTNYTLPCYGLKLHDWSYSGDSVLMIFRDRGAEDYTKLTLYSMTDDDESTARRRTMTLEEGALGVFSMSARLVVVTPDEIVRYRSNANIDTEKEFDAQITSVIKLKVGKLLVFRGTVPYLVGD